jgi:AraC-like DNA-binding protein
MQRAPLEDPDHRLPSAAATRLWAAAYETARDPDLALHAAAALPFGAYKVIDFLASNAPTVGGALRQVSKYFPLINSEVHLPISESSDGYRVALVSSKGPTNISRPYAEYSLAAVYLRTRQATSNDFSLSSICFEFPKPTHVAEHERAFQCPVYFSAARTEFTLTREVWDLPNANANPALFDVLEEHARDLLKKVPTEPAIVHEVRQAIGAQLRGGDPSLESVAKGLGRSPRTLQRHLKEWDVTYGALLDQERDVTARCYLGDRSLCIAEVAFLTGFSEQSSFNHAFKRWTGRTPTEYRRSLSGREGSVARL